MAVFAIGAFVLTFLWADTIEKNNQSNRYHSCMHLLFKMLPDTDPIDRNQFCRTVIE